MEHHWLKPPTIPPPLKKNNNPSTHRNMVLFPTPTSTKKESAFLLFQIIFTEIALNKLFYQWLIFFSKTENWMSRGNCNMGDWVCMHWREHSHHVTERWQSSNSSCKVPAGGLPRMHGRRSWTVPCFHVQPNHGC